MPLAPRIQSLRWKAAELAMESPSERKARLRRFRAAFEAHRERLVEALQADLGRPSMESELLELHPTAAELGHALRNVKVWMKDRPVPRPLSLLGTRSRIHPEPKGLVLVMAPWNYPVLLLLGPLVGALAAGNAVMLKPSEKAPATAQALEALVREAFPDGEVDLAQGGPDVAQELLEQRWDHLCFTGSTRIGRTVMASAAKHLSGLTLELGGKSPALVTPTANLRRAARAIAWGKRMNAGQTCVAPDYVLVQETVFEPFLEALKTAFQEMDAEPSHYGALVDDAAFLRQAELLKSAVSRGARVVHGGDLDAPHRRLELTVLVGVPQDHPLMSEEIFGPLLPVIPYRDEGEAKVILHRLDEPLAAYVFAGSRAEEAAWIRATRAGGTALGQTLLHLANPHLPFGGRGPSGQGAYHGEEGFWTFSHARSVLKQGWLEPIRIFHPPYGGWVQKVGMKVLRWME